MSHNDFLQTIPEDVVCTHKTNFVGLTNDYHQHSNYEIYLMLNGETNIFFDEQGYHMTRGKGIFIRSDVFHRLEYLNMDVYDRINIHIKDTFFKQLNHSSIDLTELFNHSMHNTHAVFTLTEEEITEFSHQCHQLENSLRLKAFGDEILVECILRQLLVYINRISMNKNHISGPDVSVPPLIRDIIAYIHENLMGDLSIQNLGQTFHHNSHYISRRFKDTLGISLQQYIIYKRLDIAKQYLSAGYPLNRVCYLSGFNDYSNFAKTFSKYVGLPPKKYQLSSLNR